MLREGAFLKLKKHVAKDTHFLTWSLQYTEQAGWSGNTYELYFGDTQL